MATDPKQINALFQEHPHFTAIINTFKQRNISTVLDLGCNTGTHLIRLIEEGFAAEGIDDSPEDIEIANKRLNDKGFAPLASIAEIEAKIQLYPDASFDAVISINFPNNNILSNLGSALLEINRLLKPHGLLFIVIPATNLTEESFKSTLNQHFKILEFAQDQQQNFIVLAEEK
ncbi:MAG: class I SAM-dependent methyltransferase [bacterium]